MHCFVYVFTYCWRITRWPASRLARVRRLRPLHTKRSVIRRTTAYMSAPGVSSPLLVRIATQSVNVVGLYCVVWQCNEVCGDGEQTRQVWCKMTAAIAGVVSDILPDAWCDSRSRPADTQPCNAGSCTGAEWMSSDWSPVSSVQFSSVAALHFVFHEVY